MEATPENLERTARWMRLTTALTRYEAGACLAAFDFAKFQRVLDVGGNSGEFVLQLCRAHANLHAAVYDLPVVCEIGAAHVADAPEAPRIDFVKRDRAVRALPAGHDLVCFKSMLHDWPEAEMADFLQRAFDALQPGGTVMIFEREQWQMGDTPVAYGQLPLLLFFRSYRRPEVYEAQLSALGFVDVSVAHVALDMPFILVTAVKPGRALS